MSAASGEKPAAIAKMPGADWLGLFARVAIDYAFRAALAAEPEA